MTYQVSVDLSGKTVLVVGGGPAAARHAAACAAEGARVRVVASAACEDVVDGVADGRWRWTPREWDARDLAGAWLVVAATGGPDGDREVVAAAASAGVWSLADAAPAPLQRERAARRPAGDGIGRVALVGGGPGDAGLMTVEGARLVHEADVVVVDRLAPRAVLAGLDPDVEIVDVGKSPDHHPVPQEEINRLLVAHARAGRRVVRLKGGDSFVFGRGQEEVDACRAAGVPVRVVPGVTSAFAVPAAAGIPVTTRGASRSVTVLTGHERPDPASCAALVALGGTVVVLMGVSRLPDLVAGLLDAGMAPETPFAAVERGWTPAQRTTRAPLGGAVAAVSAAGVTSPAVLVIGEVARG